jgi:hypothetical protein
MLVILLFVVCAVHRVLRMLSRSLNEMHLASERTRRGEAHFNVCCLINISTATSHHLLSFPSELVLVGNPSGGSVCIVPGRALEFLITRFLA